MGMIVEGRWQERDQPVTRGGEFDRKPTTFRNWVTVDGSPGPSGVGGFAAEADRYRLYVSYACPWAHRTLIARSLLGLKTSIKVIVTSPINLDQGWTFLQDFSGVDPDPEGATYLHEVYTRVDPRFTGRVTVPVLYDTKTDTIVNNESEEIIRMFTGAFRNVADVGPEIYPEELRDSIHAINERVYHTVNNGVYRAGFARTQERHDRAVNELFDTLDVVEETLTSSRWLVGNRFTEADLRLFVTLVRFDPVYNVHFKCSKKRVMDYPALWGFVRDVHQTPGVAETVHMDHIRDHYYRCHTSINPRQFVAAMPDGFDLDLPHGRGDLGPAVLDRPPAS